MRTIEEMKTTEVMKKMSGVIKTKKTVAYMAIVVILAAGVILAQNIGPWAGKSNDGLQAAAGSAVTVEVRQAEMKPILPLSTYDATLLAAEEGMVGADVPGKVVRILFKEGEVVKKGTPLIVLDSRDMNDQLQAAQAQLAAVQAALPKAQANVEISERNYNNAKALAEVGAVAPNDLRDAETALKVAQADLESLNSNIAAALSGVDRLQHNLDNMVIKAPIDGVVEDKNIIVGAYVAPGVPLAMVKNTGSVQAVIKIPQDDIGKVQMGQKARVKIGDGSQAYDGTVTYVSTAASMASRTFMAKVEVPNEDGTLKPGIYASVEIMTGSEVPVLVIPLQAVAGSEGSYYVFTADNGAARRTAVTLGAIYDDMIEVKSGLTAGAGVICTNINELQDGNPITVTGQPDTADAEQPGTAAAEQRQTATAGQGE